MALFIGLATAVLAAGVALGYGMVWAGRSQLLPADLSDAALQQETALQAALMQAFDFDRLDLESNRQGTLSARQQHNQRAGRSLTLTMGVMALIIIAVGFYYAAVGIPGVTELSRPDTSGRPSILLGGVIAVVLVGGSAIYTRRVMGDQFSRRLSRGEGPVKGQKAGRPGEIPQVMIGRVAIPVWHDAQAQALSAGRVVHVYYLRARVNIVLSIEPLEDETNQNS